MKKRSNASLGLGVAIVALAVSELGPVSLDVKLFFLGVAALSGINICLSLIRLGPWKLKRGFRVTSSIVWLIIVVQLGHGVITPDIVSVSADLSMAGSTEETTITMSETFQNEGAFEVDAIFVSAYKYANDSSVSDLEIAKSALAEAQKVADKESPTYDPVPIPPQQTRRIDMNGPLLSTKNAADLRNGVLKIAFGGYVLIRRNGLNFKTPFCTIYKGTSLGTGECPSSAFKQ